LFPQYQKGILGERLQGSFKHCVSDAFDNEILTEDLMDFFLGKPIRSSITLLTNTETLEKKYAILLQHPFDLWHILGSLFRRKDAEASPIEDIVKSLAQGGIEGIISPEFN